MAIIIINAAAALLAVAFAGLDAGAATPAATLLAAVILVATLLARRSRIAFTRATGLFFPTLASLLALTAAAAWGGAHVFDPSAPDFIGGVRAAAPVLTVGLAGFAYYAAGFAYGRTAAAIGLMACAPLTAAIVLVAGGPARDAAQHGAAFGMIALLCLFTIADEIRRRPTLGGPPPPPLTRRLFAPIAGLLSAFAVLAWEGAAAALVAFVIGAAVFLAALTIRAQRSRLGLAILPVSAGAAFAAALLGGGAALLNGGADRLLAAFGGLERSALATAHALQRAPILGDGATTSGAPAAVSALHGLGLAGYAAMALGVALLAAALSAMKDGGRRPSRGFALVLGLAAFALASAALSPDFASPSAALTFALMLGQAASFRDQRRAARSQPES